jgi:CHAT domain-containing protein
LYAVDAGGEQTTAILASRATARAVALASGDSLVPAVARFVASLEAGRDARALGRALGAALLDDILRDLPPSLTKIVIVPDGILHRVPFDALTTADGRFVVQRFETSIAPSATIATSLWTQRRAGRSSGALLAYGDPVFASTAPRSVQSDRGGREPVDALPRLRGSGDEVRRLSRYQRAAIVRVRGDASESHLKRNARGRTGILHLATHALVDDWSVARTAIALTPGDGEDGFLTPGEIAMLNLAVDLVVLSACRSAGGEILGGEGVRGLATPFLQAGASAVLATGWRVPDRRVVAFVDAFYGELSRGRTIGSALRQAKLRLMTAGAPIGEWSVFSVVGHANATIPLRAMASREADGSGSLR